MKSVTISISILAVAIVCLALVLLVKPFNNTFGAAFTGSPSFIQSATTTTITGGVGRTLFASTPDCKARVVTTTNAGVWFTLGTQTNGNLSSSTLNQNLGHYQATNTTAIYDSGLVGCGLLFGTSSLTTTLTLSEF